MNRNEFLRRARRYARRNGLDYHFDQERAAKAAMAPFIWATP